VQRIHSSSHAWPRRPSAAVDAAYRPTRCGKCTRVCLSASGAGPAHSAAAILWQWRTSQSSQSTMHGQTSDRRTICTSAGCSCTATADAPIPTANETLHRRQRNHTLPCAMGPAGWRSGAVKGARLCFPLLEVIVYRQLHLAIELHVRPCNRPLALLCTVLSSPTTEPARRLSSSRRAHLIYS
jgi:hypothetical protein